MTGLLIALGVVAFAFLMGWLMYWSLGSGNGDYWEDGDPDHLRARRPPGRWRGRD
jgi:hypothetical protein